MKVIQRSVIKIVPGKMAEAMELQEKHTAIATRYGMPSPRIYRLISGQGDFMHTLIYEYEWDSLAAWAAAADKMYTETDPEMQALMPKWDAIIESHGLELYTPMP